MRLLHLGGRLIVAQAVLSFFSTRRVMLMHEQEGRNAAMIHDVTIHVPA